MAMRKATIAKEAVRQLNGLVEMLTERGNWDVAGVRYHANSANNYIASVRAVGMPLPEPIIKNTRFLQVHGWRISA